MKTTFILILLFLSCPLFAQKPCEYSSNVTDSLGTYKSTKEYLISEKIFGKKTNSIFYSLALTDGLPSLTVQQISKSKEFMKANCLDKNSRLFLQLDNGKIITLLFVAEENCGTMIRDNKGFDVRVLSGTFMFMKENFEELKKSPISLMRIKYMGDTEDYIIKKEIKSELDNLVYQPADYFINNLRCVE